MSIRELLNNLHLLPESNEGGDIGKIGLRWRNLFAKSVTVDTITYVTMTPPVASLPIDLTTGVTGTLPVGSGGTGQTATTAGYVKGGATMSLQTGVPVTDLTGTPVTVGQGGTGTNSTLSGYLKGGSPITAQAVPIPVTDGGTGVVSPTTHRLLIGQGAAAVVSLAAMTDGQLVVGSTGADPVAATLGAGVGIVNSVGAGTLSVAVSLSTLTNSLSGDVALNNTANYFDGPSVAQGTSGTWFVSGTVTCVDTANLVTFYAKLWDGTTTIASLAATSGGANFRISLSLSGYITAPAGNLRISVRDSDLTTGAIRADVTGAGKDSTISAIRIA